MQKYHYCHYRWRIIPLILVVGIVKQEGWIRSDVIHNGISSNSSTILIKLNNTTASSRIINRTEELHNNSLLNVVTGTTSNKIFNRTKEPRNTSSLPKVGTTFPSSRISFRIEPGPRTSLGPKKDPILPWTCTGKQQNNDFPERWPLAPEMRSAFNFTTSIRTNLKILVMGDSIGLQLSEYLQSLLRTNEWDYDNDDDDNNNTTRTLASTPPTILQRALQLQRAASIHVTSPLEQQEYNIALGAIAGWRMIGMFLRKNHGKAKANKDAGWGMKYVQKLRDYVSRATFHHQNETMLPQNITVGKEGLNKVQLNYRPSGNFDV
eukprot:CAMPEP_0178936002 /NCGR_PEP_ID=MMETSP0786-20121207/24890_1 /TAXON_ID=186022 /ORGANISM="Thalassionema frauenfeldii, Strain CCMP 1798" /LENGTH=320 /DNA_ID=CAMNT_0020614275 /DNA_START=60 /DNA_END=1018 /DNA_ORIENTATION=+